MRCWAKGGNVFPITFNTGHALPLTLVRFLCPRISRAHGANCPRIGREEAPNHGHGLVLGSDVSRPHPRTRQSLDQAVNTATPRPCPCPRSVRIQQPGVAANCPWSGNVPAQSAVSPYPWAAQELTRAFICPRPTCGIVQTASSPRSRQSSHNEAPAYVLI